MALLKRKRRWLAALVLCGGLAFGGVWLRGSAPFQAEVKPLHVSARPQLPLRFEANRGQSDPRVRFLARGPQFGLYLTDQGATLVLQRPRPNDPIEGKPTRRRGPTPAEQVAISMHVRGGRSVAPTGGEQLPGTTSYLLGSDASRWRQGVEGFARATYRGVAPGVDLVFYGSAERRLEYDLVMAPGVDPDGVWLAFDGPKSVAVDARGDAVLRLDGGEVLRQPLPLAYQDDGHGGRTIVDVRYRAGPDRALGFVVGQYDRSRSLVIDPRLIYSTYLGGHSTDYALAVATDAQGNAYVTGQTLSSDFPITIGALPHGGAADLFVSKLDPTGTMLLYSTYLGGGAEDAGTGIAVDAAGNAYVTGFTSSSDFPTLSPVQAARAGGFDAVVFKLSPTGDALIYSTYLGGSGDDFAQGIAIDGAGRAYVTGDTKSANFRRVAALQTVLSGPRDAFVSKFEPAGNVLTYSTLLGGSQDDIGFGIAVDAGGNAFVTGQTFSPNFPLVSPLQATAPADTYSDAFVTKVNPAGSALVYSTYLGGGTGDEIAYGIAVDARGDALVGGYTNSTDFPLAAAGQATYAGGITDAFVSKLNPAGGALLYSTFLGGSGLDLIWGLASDPGGSAYVTGYTQSTNFPTTNGAPQAASAGGSDAFIGKFSIEGSLIYSTYRGGAGTDYGIGIAVSRSGVFFVAGQTDSTNFPVTEAAQSTSSGYDDAFVTRLDSFAAVPAGDLRSLGMLAFCLCTLALATLGRRRAR